VSATIIVALDRTPAARVVEYAGQLADSGASVCMVVADAATATRLRASGVDPRVRTNALLRAEPAPLPRRLDRIYVALVRPWLLGWRWRRLLADVATAERIVAADMSATTLVWRLSRRYPDIVATTALDPPVAITRSDS
jgi:hypothetical protein